MSKTNLKVDVLVSGAGPVGLFFAYQMATRGHSVYILDPKSGLTDFSKAIVVSTRSMEILEGKGLAAEFISESFLASGMRAFRNGVVAAEIDANGDTPFPHQSIIMQAVTERILYERLLADTECRVHWDNELVSYTQDDHTVTSIIRDNIKQEEYVVESTYIVGADGTHSRVRKGNPDWTYDGVAIKTKFGLADLTLKGDDVQKLANKVNLFIGTASMIGIIEIKPLHETGGDQVFRIFGNLEDYEINNNEREQVSHGLGDGKAEAPPTLEFVQEWIDRAANPLKLEASNLIWSSFFRINERLANGFRKKRAFVIGDAAHCHSPAGGQGMNLGLQDAHNLAWKMSDVLRGLSADPETLLDSYSDERLPHAQGTLNATSSATHASISGKGIIGSCRAMLASAALMLPQVRQLAFKNLMQQLVTITPKSKVMGTSDKGLLQAGQFLPESSVLRRSIVTKSKLRRVIKRQTIREILVGNEKYTAIFVGTCYSSSVPNDDLMEKFWEDTRVYPIRRLVIQSAWHYHFSTKYPSYVLDEEKSIAEESFYSEERIDLPNSMTSRVGLLPLLNSYFASGKPPSVLLILRPDFYVAQVKTIASGSDLDNALHFLSTTLITTA